jgi:Flp pilus assembly protein TadG
MHPTKQSGVVAVELALILPLMLVLCFGITELGRALYQYNGLVKATRGAVRYLSTQSVSAETILATRSLALCGQRVCASNDELVPGLTLTQISTSSSLASVDGSTVNLVSVTIGSTSGTGVCGTDLSVYCFTSMVPWVVPSFAFGPVSITMASQVI